MNAKNDAAGTRILLAQLALEHHKLDEAAKYAGDAATELAAEKDTGDEPKRAWCWRGLCSHPETSRERTSKAIRPPNLRNDPVIVEPNWTPQSLPRSSMQNQEKLTPP